VPGALLLRGLTGSTTTATSTSNFNTLLTSIAFDLVIFGEQNSSSVFTEVSAALTSYIAGGGKVLGTTWLNSDFATLMGASGRVATNQTTITTDGSPIFAGLGPTIELTNPGWGIFSSSWTPDGGNTGLGTLGTGSAVVQGNGGRTLLYGPLFDTYDDLPQGERFIANGIGLLLDETTAVPEPATVAMLGIGLIGIWRASRRSRAA
jgi:PEP-CTERM motif